MTLLKDLIHIPDPVHKGDFVLKLAEGVLHPTETLRDCIIKTRSGPRLTSPSA